MQLEAQKKLRENAEKLRENAEKQRDELKEEKRKLEHYIADLLKSRHSDSEKIKKLKAVLDD